MNTATQAAKEAAHERSAAYDEGVLARQNREPSANVLNAYPGNPNLAVEWSRGWQSQMAADMATPGLSETLQAAGLFADADQLDLLTEEQRLAMVEWLDTAPVEQNDAEWNEFGCRIPAFASLTQATVQSNDGYSMLVVLSFSELQPVAEIPGGDVTEQIEKPAKTTPEERDAKRLKAADRAAMKLDKCQIKVSQCEAAVEQAKGNLKAAIGDYDAAVASLRKALSGKDEPRLPTMEDADDPDDEPDGLMACNPELLMDGAPFPIDSLGKKKLTATVGDAVIASYKDREEPIGLTDNQLEKFASVDIATVADLEKRMRENRDWWSFLAGKQDSKIVANVMNSHLEFRRVHPVPEEERPKTINESLAEKNQAATEQAAV